MISRSYVWVNEDIEHSDADESRAHALASRWSSLMTNEEDRAFRRQADYEDGGGYDPEPDHCETCQGTCMMGVDGPYGRHGIRAPEWAVGIKCTNPFCEDGYDMQDIREYETRQRNAQAERDLEIELIEDKLSAIGARMMRPYEHWNEDESYMQYMEEGRFA
jgi:hypothetical protein